MHSVIESRVSLPAVHLALAALAVAAPAGSAPQLPRIAGAALAPSAVIEPATAVDDDPGAPLAETADAVREGIATASLNLREGPATSFSRVALLQEGRGLRILREDGDWFYVTAEKDAGWVHRDFVRVAPAPGPPPEFVAELEDLRFRQATWETERRSLEHRIAKLEEDREDLQEAIREMRGEVSFTGATVKQAFEPGRRPRFLTRVLGGREDDAGLLEQVRVLEAERSDLSASLAALRAELGAAGDRGRALGLQLEQARTELEELRRLRAAPVESPESVAALTALRAELETVRQQLKGELAASEQARESLWANLATIQEENRALREELGRPPAAGALAMVVGGSAPAETVLPERVAGWAEAWSGQRFEDYIRYYASDFEPDGELSLDAWRAIRRSRLVRPEYIQVAISDVTVDQTGPSRATTTFEQSYESNRYSDRVRKRLDWIAEEGTWRILRETAEPLR